MAEDEQTFRDPELAINRVYTKKGDRGKTRLVGGQHIDKHALRIEAYGTLDELNAFIGAARQSIASEYGGESRLKELSETLLRVQHELFNLGSVFATLPEDRGEKMPRVTDEDVRALEESIDALNAELPTLRSFILPGGSQLNADLHVCRTICRRAERIASALGEQDEVDPQGLAYLNRLSDAFFVWSRWASHIAGTPEVLWQPNMASSAAKKK